MEKDLNIYFVRMDKNYPLSGICSYTPTKKMKKKIIKLVSWLQKHNNINILLGNCVFFDSIKMFCYSNDLDYNKPLNLISYVNNKFYIEVEQTNKYDYKFDNQFLQTIGLPMRNIR